MRIHGYCTKCRKIKLVEVAPRQLAKMAHRRGVAAGVCSACAETTTPNRAASL